MAHQQPQQPHPRRAAIHERLTVGERLADGIAAGMGSWKFIIIQTVIVIAWIGVNLWLLSHPFDAWPFILLNLLFSTQAAYAAPVIMMSQNRQSGKDRKRDDVEASEVDLLVKLLQQNTDLTRDVHAALTVAHVMIGPDGYAGASALTPLMPPTLPTKTMMRRPRDPQTGRFLKLPQGG